MTPVSSAGQKKRDRRTIACLFFVTALSVIIYGTDVSLILLHRPALRYSSSYVQIPSHNHHFHSSGNGLHG